MIPPFTNEGFLPPGDYEVTLAALRESVLVRGPRISDPSMAWDARWRAMLVDNLEILTQQLWQVGITDVFVNGSFVEDKAHPNDIDGYFICDLARLRSGQLVRDLNLIDPDKVWTWDPASRRPYRGYPKRQLPMWHRYRVELYPHVSGLGIGIGILDQHGNELEFPAAFRQSRRDGRLKGIVKLSYGGRP